MDALLREGVGQGGKEGGREKEINYMFSLNGPSNLPTNKPSS